MPVDDELRELRARAYGPDADIDADPDALIRLRELEDRERAVPAPVPAPAPAPAERTESAPDPHAEPVRPEAVMVDATGALPADATVALGDASPQGRADAAASPATVAPAAAADARPWRRRRTLFVWAATLVLAALLGAVVTMWVQVAPPGRVAVLGVDADAQWPESFFGGEVDGAEIFEAFEGMTVLVTPQEFGGDADIFCLYVLAGAPADAQSRMMTAGCGARALAIVTSLVVTAAAPAEVKERFTEGTVLRFSLEGERVSVFAANP